MATDYLLKNAPLIEVIAELHWRLKPIFGSKAAALDPHLDEYIASFSKASGSAGFSFVEKNIPDDVPRELLAHQSLLRFRKAANEWPLFQVGPGLFAANITPPYRGWKSFDPILRQGIEILLNSYPTQYLEIERIELRYLDGFTAKHGLTDDLGEFLRKDLFFGGRSDSLTGLIADNGTLIQTGQQVFPTKSPKGSNAILELGTGAVGSETAIMAQFIVRGGKIEGELTVDEILNWYNEAHSTMHEWFKLNTSDRLREAMGPKEDIS